jgi:hypothetical protein
MPQEKTLPIQPFLSFGVLQGLMLFLLQQHPIAHHLLIPLVTFLIVFPPMAMLANHQKNLARLFIISIGFSALLASTTYNHAYPIAIYGHFFWSTIDTILIVTAACSIFFASAHQAGSIKPPYHLLYQHTWKQMLSLFCALIIGVLIWLMLWLWAELFSSISITLFSTLFFKQSFFVFSTPIMFALGLFFAQRYTAIVQGLQKMLLTLGIICLPIIATTLLLFLPTILLQHKLPNSNLLTWMLLLSILLINCMVQSGEKKIAYPRLIHGLITLFIVILPIIGALNLFVCADWAGKLRTSQQLSVYFNHSMLMAYCCAYSFLLIKKRDTYQAVIKSNQVLVFILIAGFILVNNPLIQHRPSVAIHKTLHP